MPALYLSAPGRTAAQDPTSPSVSAIYDSGIAPGYAFASTELPQIEVGMNVVVFSRDPEEQLEARLEAIRPNGEQQETDGSATTSTSGNGARSEERRVGKEGRSRQ